MLSVTVDFAHLTSRFGGLLFWPPVTHDPSDTVSSFLHFSVRAAIPKVVLAYGALWHGFLKGSDSLAEGQFRMDSIKFVIFRLAFIQQKILHPVHLPSKLKLPGVQSGSWSI